MYNPRIVYIIVDVLHINIHAFIEIHLKKTALFLISYLQSSKLSFNSNIMVFS